MIILLTPFFSLKSKVAFRAVIIVQHFKSNIKVFSYDPKMLDTAWRDIIVLVKTSNVCFDGLISHVFTLKSNQFEYNARKGKWV